MIRQNIHDNGVTADSIFFRNLTNFNRAKPSKLLFCETFKRTRKKLVKWAWTQSGYLNWCDSILVFSSDMSIENQSKTIRDALIDWSTTRDGQFWEWPALTGKWLSSPTRVYLFFLIIIYAHWRHHWNASYFLVPMQTNFLGSEPQKFLLWTLRPDQI